MIPNDIIELTHIIIFCNAVLFLVMLGFIMYIAVKFAVRKALNEILENFIFEEEIDHIT